QARWNGVTLGGVKPDGTDACNELTLLFMEAANRCRTPQHTLTLRVHKNMPKEVMRNALELVRTGIGMPSFVSDDNYIDTLVAKGIPLEKARDYFIIGCLDVNVPEGFGALFSMTVTALPFDTFLHNGYSPIQNLQVGPKTGDPRDMKTFEEFQDKLLEHYKYYLDCYAKERLLRYLARLEVFQDSFGISLFSDGVKVGQSGMKRKMPYEIGPTIGMGVGTINVCDSLNVIKKLVYDEKKLTMDELINALDANWEGERNQEIRKMCLDVVKYGNDDDYADAVASEFYGKLADLGLAIPSWRGTKYCMGAISITAHEPGGKLLGATPDGRYAGTMLADGCASPIQGADVNGPTAVLNSADKLPQHKFQSMLLNMKFHPNALKTDEDLDKLAVMIHTYLENGGKQIQFNAVDTETLKAAQKNPEAYRDLIVRVAGYSTYFVLLSQDMQNEIIRRTCYEAV
ncbi:MAG: hypothetical protein IJ461_02755, partial [Clostridia bacterium]|nr:hypothetical protein [Clostridia bacterium]